MKKMTELVFEVEPGSEEAGIITALMFDAGADGIYETETGISVFFLYDIYISNAESVRRAAGNHKFVSKIHEPRNWNSEWEKNYPLVTVSDRIVVYAPFHANVPDLEYRILIHPGMAFGTGHHSTTALMMKLMLETDIKNKTVVDMGCGSGVLAVLASLMGAEKVFAIDNDHNSYENSLKNAEANSCKNIVCIEGDAAALEGKTADVLIANITRNILLSDFERYIACMAKESVIMLSGFLLEDADVLREKAASYNLKELCVLTENEWAALAFTKNEN